MELLLGRGDVAADAKDRNGRTPLSWAAEYGSRLTVGLLVERKNVWADSLDNNGKTPLYWLMTTKLSSYSRNNYVERRSYYLPGKKLRLIREMTMTEHLFHGPQGMGWKDWRSYF
jgi:hypothetical protein